MPIKDREKFLTLLNGSNYENLFKDKKYIEDAYALVESDLNKSPNLVPGKFKIYNYDNFTVEMCDYVFDTEDGKTMTWVLAMGEDTPMQASVTYCNPFKAAGWLVLTLLFSGVGYLIWRKKHAGLRGNDSEH